MKFKIFAGLSGGFGGAVCLCIHECFSEKEAIDFAYSLAMEEYESYAGMHGLTGYDELLADNPEISEDELEDLYREEAETWIDYYVEKIK